MTKNTVFMPLPKDNIFSLSDHHVMLDSSKPTTLSAGMGAFVAIASVSVLFVVGTVVCVIRYRRSRLRSSDMLEVNENEPLTG